MLVQNEGCPGQKGQQQGMLYPRSAPLVLPVFGESLVMACKPAIPIYPTSPIFGLGNRDFLWVLFPHLEKMKMNDTYVIGFEERERGGNKWFMHVSGTQ